MPTTQNVQNVQNVQNIQNVQHTTVPMHTPPAQAQFFHMPAPQTPPAQVQPAQTAVIQNPPPEMPAPMTDWSSEITVPPESGAAQQPSVSQTLRRWERTAGRYQRCRRSGCLSDCKTRRTG